MKAKDYLDKYRIDIQGAIKNKQVEALNKIGSDILIDFSMEAGGLIRSRKITRHESAGAVMIELNQKWNTLMKLFEKEFGFPLLKENGFISFWETRIPELIPYMSKIKQ